MKVVTSTTVFQDSVGMRMSITYSEVDDQTGKIIADNKRENRVLTDKTAKSHANSLLSYAQDYIDSLEG